MLYELSRRSLLSMAVAGPFVCQSGLADEQRRDAPKTLDIHLHLFGTGDSGSGCKLSSKITEGPLFPLLVDTLQIRDRAKTMDAGFLLALAEQLDESGLDKGVVLAQDAAYDADGKPDWRRTHFFVPNDYVLQATARFPERMIPCVSINPQRADAVAELERCADLGARVLKIHPPTQRVDLNNAAYIPFFRRCVELNFVVMVHTGHEHSAPIGDIDLANPRKLTLALEEGCTVVACHCGTGWPTDAVDMVPDFLKMVRKYPNLWGDTAVLGTAARVRDTLRIFADQGAADRLLHGSDFPFPSMPLAFSKKLGWEEAGKIQGIPNLISRDFQLKEALGVGRASAERACDLVTGAEA